MDFSFLKVNFEKIECRLRSFFSVKGKINVDIDRRKTEIGILTQIQEQKNLNAPITNNTFNILVTDSPENAKMLDIIEKFKEDTVNLQLVSSDSTGKVTLPEAQGDSESKRLLKKHLTEHQKKPSLFIDIGGLFFFYEERMDIDFTEEELVFLLQASLKNDFPFWFWSFLYRERFGNVVPLFKKAFGTADRKIRLKVVEAIDKFSGTADNIAEFAETEKDETVLGTIVVKLFEKGETVYAQRVITNAISRRLIPEMDYKNIKTLSAEIGRNEKSFLHETIKNGWPNQKLKALNVLSVTTSDSDLPLLENILESRFDMDIILSILHCIARIGKTNKIEVLEKQLEDARSEELFIQAIETLVAVKDKTILPQLFNWLKDSSTFTWRFSLMCHEWKLNNHLEKAILSLLDKDFYEVIVRDILSHSQDKYRYLYTWRQFSILKSVEDEKMIQLIKQETRLNDCPEWRDMLEKIVLNEALRRNDKKDLLALVTPTNYTNAMLSLRQIWKIISQEEAFKLRDTIEKLRRDLIQRLHIFVEGDYPQTQKSLAKHGIDYFLGENTAFYRSYAETREKDKNDPFKKLMDDIGSFDRIEDEFISFILKERNKETEQFLLDHIGRPFRNIYDAVSLTWPVFKKKEIEESLKDSIESCKNPLVKLSSISAARRMEVIDFAVARDEIRGILFDARKKLKESTENKNNYDWFAYSLVYSAAANRLSEIGHIEDFPLIEESINRKNDSYWFFHMYSNFHHIKSLEKLIDISNTTKKEKEKESALSAIDTLDYWWSKKILGIES